MAAERLVYYLRSQAVSGALDRHHLTHRELAAHLDLSKSYWSLLVNQHHPLSAKVRRRLLSSRYFRGVAEAELWETRAIQEPA